MNHFKISPPSPEQVKYLVDQLSHKRDPKKRRRGELVQNSNPFMCQISQNLFQRKIDQQASKSRFPILLNAKRKDRMFGGGDQLLNSLQVKRMKRIENPDRILYRLLHEIVEKELPPSVSGISLEIRQEIEKLSRWSFKSNQYQIKIEFDQHFDNPVHEAAFDEIKKDIEVREWNPRITLRSKWCISENEENSLRMSRNVRFFPPPELLPIEEKILTRILRHAKVGLIELLPRTDEYALTIQQEDLLAANAIFHIAIDFLSAESREALLALRDWKVEPPSFDHPALFLRAKQEYNLMEELAYSQEEEILTSAEAFAHSKSAEEYGYPEYRLQLTDDDTSVYSLYCEETCNF